MARYRMALVCPTCWRRHVILSPWLRCNVQLYDVDQWPSRGMKRCLQQRIHPWHCFARMDQRRHHLVYLIRVLIPARTSWREVHQHPLVPSQHRLSQCHHQVRLGWQSYRLRGSLKPFCFYVKLHHFFHALMPNKHQYLSPRLSPLAGSPRISYVLPRHPCT